MLKSRYHILTVLLTAGLLSSVNVALALSPLNSLTPAELAEGWILLWDGKTDLGWEKHGLQPEWKMAGDALVSETGKDSWMVTTSQFADFRLKVDYLSPADGNSGIFIRTGRKGEPAQSGYEVQICDMHRLYPTGSLVGIKEARKIRPNPDAWHTMEIVAEKDHLAVRLDASKVLDVHDSTFSAGYIGLQYNRSHPIRFRNLKLKPLGQRAIFSGTDLSGWNRISRGDVQATGGWSVQNGMIHGVASAELLETTAKFQNFILQLEARFKLEEPGKFPAGAIVLRGEPGKPDWGYQVPLGGKFHPPRINVAPGESSESAANGEAVEGGTAREGEFFSQTILIQGPHLAVWINGVQISDFTDVKPAGMKAFSNQARLAAGTIGLEVFPEAGWIDFRKLLIVDLPQ